jgi:hypothetical protein
MSILIKKCKKQDDDCQDMADYKQSVIDNVYGLDDRTWAGLRPYPWIEFGSLVERKQGCIISSARPRKTGRRLGTELGR